MKTSIEHLENLAVALERISKWIKQNPYTVGVPRKIKQAEKVLECMKLSAHYTHKSMDGEDLCKKIMEQA